MKVNKLLTGLKKVKVHVHDRKSEQIKKNEVKIESNSILHKNLIKKRKLQPIMLRKFRQAVNKMKQATELAFADNSIYFNR